VRIGFETLDSRILPDMGVKVTFLRDERQSAVETSASARPATLVPKGAIRMDDVGSYLFVVGGPDGDTVARRTVRVGDTDGDRVEVLGDVRAGDRVVMSPPQELVDGARVVVR
jgi:multidrug efflux pump subunit AcrA (membrane-fusion protein)